MKHFAIFPFIFAVFIGFSPLECAENGTLTVDEKYQMYSHRLHPHSYHHPQRHKKTLIELKDGSIWTIHPSDKFEMKSWKKKDEIFIKPAYSCFWSDFFIVYKYILYNRSLNKLIYVYFETPAADAFTIEQIDPFLKIIQLNDQTTWKIDEKVDFSNWQVGNRIMVGVNNKWYTADYPQILINVDLANQPYLEAIFIENIKHSEEV